MKWLRNRKQRNAVLMAVMVVLCLVVGFGLYQVPNEETDPMTQPSSMTNMPSATVGTAKVIRQRPVPMKFVRNGQNVRIDMYTEETTIQIADGVRVQAWTFDGTVPGPVLYLNDGDHVTLTLHNLDKTMAHSIDLHAAIVAPNENFVDVPPGQSKTFRFDANLPGVFMYHCATAPMVMHIGMGMYGAVVVTPKHQARPTYTLVQSEIYPSGQLQDMLDGSPTYVVFNGVAHQYMDHPLTAKVGKPIQIAFVNAGPNAFSAFHVVGTVIRDAHASGNLRNHLYDVQTDTVAPGDGALFDLTFTAPGTYPFLTHAAKDAEKGAMGTIVVTK